MVKRIKLDKCAAVLIDVQEYFLENLGAETRAEIESHSNRFSKLIRHLNIPLIATFERPVSKKKKFPSQIEKTLEGYERAFFFEKDFFDLTKHGEISIAIRNQGKSQLLIGGCETDFCVMQSCLGLLEQGYELFLVEELLFSSSLNVSAARKRLENEGAVFVSFKTLYYELLEAIEESPLRTVKVPPGIIEGE